MKQGLPYLSVCSLRILYNSKFIFIATSLGTDDVVVTRVHCSCFLFTFQSRILYCGSSLFSNFENIVLNVECSSRLLLSVSFLRKAVFLGCGFPGFIYANLFEVVFVKCVCI